tara:strand:- start:67 stop:432 length:366 start_codon:yes stop_codon:yes gene_type:complete
MGITRLSNVALENILLGKTKQNFKCVVKFYSSKCKLCHGLKPIYENISEAFEDDLHFFVFNAEQKADLNTLIDINGTPTIVFVDVRPNPNAVIMADPAEPDKETWYHVTDIMNFIEENLND